VRQAENFRQLGDAGRQAERQVFEVSWHVYTTDSIGISRSIESFGQLLGVCTNDTAPSMNCWSFSR
jgi:hypothetical protein